MKSQMSYSENTLASNVRRLRMLKKMSQTDLATEVGIFRNYLDRIEMGTANPSLVVIVNLANALDVLPYELLTQHGTEQRAALSVGVGLHHFDATHPMHEPPRREEA